MPLPSESRPRHRGWLVVLAVLACGPTAPMATSGETDGSTIEATDTSESLPTASAEPPDPTSTTALTTGTGELDCEGVCAEPKTHEGDLHVTPDTDPASLHCIREVTGDVWIEGFHGSLPQTLRSLRGVDDIVISGNDGLVDLAGLECLQRTRLLLVDRNDALVDISALAGLEAAEGLSFQFMDALADMSPLSGAAGVETVFIQLCEGLTTLPTFPAGTRLSLDIAGAGITDMDPLIHAEIESVSLMDMPALADISGLAGRWLDQGSSISLRRLPQLTALTGLAGLEHAGAIVIDDLPQLASLAPMQGLISVDQLELSGLPQLTTLASLAGLTEVDWLTLDGLPGLTSLAGLGGLQRVGALELGTCFDGSSGVGALVDLAGLGQLAELQTLRLMHNASLHSLAGLDALAIGPERLDIVGNPNLPADEVAAFVAAHAVPATCIDPPMQCCPAF